MICICDERQGIAGHPVSIGGELHACRLDGSGAVVDCHGPGIATEYGKAAVAASERSDYRFHRSRPGDHRPGSASTAQLAGACSAVGIPEPKRLIADIDEIDLLVCGQNLNGEGAPAGAWLIDKPPLVVVSVPV